MLYLRKEKMKRILLSILFVIYTPVIFAGAIQYTDNVVNLRVIHWTDNRACINVGEKWFKLDMSTEKGKASYSLALTAFTIGKKVDVRWLDDGVLEGGCDTGTTMYPLYNIQFAE